MKLTPQDVSSLKDTSKWADFTFEDKNALDHEDVDDGSNW